MSKLRVPLKASVAHLRNSTFRVPGASVSVRDTSVVSCWLRMLVIFFAGILDFQRAAQVADDL